jgi:hypothetical protein
MASQQTGASAPGASSICNTNRINLPPAPTESHRNPPAPSTR